MAPGTARGAGSGSFLSWRSVATRRSRWICRSRTVLRRSMTTPWLSPRRQRGSTVMLCWSVILLGRWSSRWSLQRARLPRSCSCAVSFRILTACRGMTLRRWRSREPLRGSPEMLMTRRHGQRWRQPQTPSTPTARPTAPNARTNDCAVRTAGVTRRALAVPRPPRRTRRCACRHAGQHGVAHEPELAAVHRLEPQSARGPKRRHVTRHICRYAHDVCA